MYKELINLRDMAPRPLKPEELALLEEYNNFKIKKTDTTAVLSNHIIRKKSKKTVCVTAVLTAIGIPYKAFRVTSTSKNPHAYKQVIRRNGFALRSRQSRIGDTTVGQIRKKLLKFNDPEDALYIVAVASHTFSKGKPTPTAHCILLNRQGKTLVDTSPRHYDNRPVITAMAIWKKQTINN